MTQEHLTAVERTGMIVIGGLFVIALPIMGILNVIGGSMSAMIAYTKGDTSGHALTQAAVPEGAKITAAPLVGPNTRAWLILLALLVLGAVAVYRLGTFGEAA
ncbi:MAG: hypothetical protein ABEJ84_00010 [Halodesulfurarchaeum sp.]